MKIFFDHIAGQAETREIVYAPATAIFEKHEYETALRNGWQIISSWGEPSFSWFDDQIKAGKKVWYQSRTSRLTPSEYIQKRRHKSRIEKDKNLKYSIHKEYDPKVLLEIYRKYLTARKFTDLYGDNHPFESSCYEQGRHIIVFCYCDQPVAFSILDMVGNSCVASQFCWDYAMPQLDLGKISYYVEQQTAKKLGLDHVYLGTSYEKCSLSKSNYAGFEWWTGRVWSKDIELYKKLTTNESNIETIDDLHKQQVMFYSHLDI
jgi:arginyl-tRNA--protein-N-Asp/Glu arginylyltransferase